MNSREKDLFDFTGERDVWILEEIFEIESNFHRQKRSFSNAEGDNLDDRPSSLCTNDAALF